MTETQHNPSNPDPTTIFGGPYYIHPSDTASVKLVTDIFDGTAYIDWQESIFLSLSTKNKLVFIDGSLSKPPVTDHTYKAWCRCNDLVKSWLLASVDKIVGKSVRFKKTAADVWKDLAERFRQPSSTLLYSLQKLLLLEQGNDSISEFYTKIMGIWDEMDSQDPLAICGCNNCNCDTGRKNLKSQQDSRVMMFLMKLNDDYVQARTNILMMSELPTLASAYRLCVQKERHKEIKQVVSTESLAFMADKR